MSYGRLKRSKRYDIIKNIYEQIALVPPAYAYNPFYAREVNLNHALIGKLKNNGDIIEIRNRKQKIVTSDHICYTVSLYTLSQSSVRCIEEDIEAGEYTPQKQIKAIDREDNTVKIISSETLDTTRRYVD